MGNKTTFEYGKGYLMMDGKVIGEAKDFKFTVKNKYKRTFLGNIKYIINKILNKFSVKKTP